MANKPRKFLVVPEDEKAKIISYYKNNKRNSIIDISKALEIPYSRAYKVIDEYLMEVAENAKQKRGATIIGRGK